MHFQMPATTFLQRFPFFRASDAEEFRESMQTLYGVSRVELEKPDTFRAWANYVMLGDIALGYAFCSGRMSLRFPENEHARQQIAVRGRSATTLGSNRIELDRDMPARPRWAARCASTASPDTNG